MLTMIAYLAAFALLAAMFALFAINVFGPSERAGYHWAAGPYQRSPIPLDQQMVADTPDVAED